MSDIPGLVSRLSAEEISEIRSHGPGAELADHLIDALTARPEAPAKDVDTMSTASPAPMRSTIPTGWCSARMSRTQYFPALLPKNLDDRDVLRQQRPIMKADGFPPYR